MKNISVIIPCFNARFTIEKTITSLVSQNIPFLEIIIVDDCSTDNSISFINECFGNRHEIKIVKNKKNRGAAHTRNRGIHEAKGDLILFIDSDVVMEKGALKKMLPFTQKNHIVYPLMIYTNKYIMYPNNQNDEKYLMITPCYLITRKGLDALNNLYFDENYRIYCEDTDFFLRCFLFNLTCKFVKNAVVMHMVNKSQFREDRYFRELKNSLYGFIKFYGFKLQKFDHAFRIRNIIQLLACGFFNFNLFDAQVRGYDKSKTAGYKIRKLFSHHEKITNKGSIFILFLTIKAFIEALSSSHNAVYERKKLLLALNKKSYLET